MEKLLKTIDSLKMPSLSSYDANIPGTISSAVVAAGDSVKTKKKERINHCRAVADAVCNTNVQNLTDYSKILENVTDVLFQLCNDPDSDIRLVASDCLNRIARTLKDTFQPKFHMEIYREIRKNASPRSLRTALNLFAFVCPEIRPPKCRAFLSSLLPCFAQISKRTEELLYENMAASVTEIFKCLGPFANDSEIKILCKDFINNLESNSAIVRRASASILVSICRFSKNAWDTLPKLLSTVIEILMPNLMEKSVSVIIGALLCIRQCIPHIYDEIRNGNLWLPSPEQESAIASIIQVYEMCMILCNHDDHNVITTSLETLQQLLTFPAEPILIKLTSPSGIKNSMADKSWSQHHRLSQTLASSSSDNLVFDETSNLLESDLDVPIFRSVLPFEPSNAKEESETDPSIPSTSRRNSDLFVIEGTLSDVGSNCGDFQPSDDEEDSVISLTEKNVVLHTFPEIQIGSLYEENVPIYYCARFLAYNFLLSGQSGIIRPDGEVRISAKVLATNCIVNLVAICPEIFKLTLSHVLVDTGNEVDQQRIDELIIYGTHNDPLLRGTVYVLIGTFMKSTITKNYEKPQIHNDDIMNLIDTLSQGLKDESNVGIKCAIAGVHACISELLQSPFYSPLGNKLLHDAVQTALNPYWLVKVDLIELLSCIKWDNDGSIDEIKEKTLSLLIMFLSDEDARVRTVACSGLINFIKTCAFCADRTWDSLQVFCKECVATQVDITRSLTVTRNQGSCLRCNNPSKAAVVVSLQHVLNKVVAKLNQVEDKHSISGTYFALCRISETYEPRIYKQFWGSFHDILNSQFLLCKAVDVLRTSPIIYDLTVHQSVLCLAGNLFAASEFYGVGTNENPPDEVNPFRCHNPQVISCGVQLLQHCLSVIKTYQTVIESINTTSTLRKQSASPVISPVKKFSQKLEAEKKAQDADAEKKLKGLPFSAGICPNHVKKVHESVVQTWKVYKSSLDPLNASKFTSLVVTSFNIIRKIFTCIRPDYPLMTTLIEEILKASTPLFGLCPVPIMQNIRQMLKCIFSLYDPDANTWDTVERIGTKNDLEDFYAFAKCFENTIVDATIKEKLSSDKIPDKSSLGSFIRQFETAVVTALRVYTITGDPTIQSEVLNLLVLLVRGHVNYALVDSSQVFLGFVIKQVSLMEEGHMRNPNLLSQEIFQFLTMLTHENNSNKKFCDMEKIIGLCEGLVAVALGSVSCAPSVASALKFVVHDLFVLRGTVSHTNQEKMDDEFHRDAIFQMLQKLGMYPEMLPVMWLLLKGRKLNNERKWGEESVFLTNTVLANLLEGQLIVKSMQEFNNLAAFIYSVHISAIPGPDKLIMVLTDELKKKNHDLGQFLRWCTVINCYWMMVIRRIRDSEDKNTQHGILGSFVLNILEKMMVDLRCTFRNVVYVNEVMLQIGAFLKLCTNLLKSDSCENLRQDMRSQDCTYVFVRIAKLSVEMSIVEPRLRFWLVELFASFQYPKTVVFDTLVKCTSVFSRKDVSQCVLKVVSEINEGDYPFLEEWVIVYHSSTLLNYIVHPDVVLFIRRLSTYRSEQILDQITRMLKLTESPVDILLARNILTYLERVTDSFLCETAVLGIKLLQRSNEPYLALEVSQFCCYVLSHIRTRKLLFANKDREVLREYFSDTSLQNKYPRLVTLARKILWEETPPVAQPSFAKHGGKINPVIIWCSEDVSEMEGQALAKMLNGMTYTEVSAILAQPNFNMSVLRHCFRHLQKAYRTDIMTKTEVLDLFSQKRSELMGKWPLPVAAMELILETLDTWENFTYRSENEDYIQSLLQNESLESHFSNMWAALTEMLHLKNLALKFGESESGEKECCNNFIPTKIFTMSFQYMNAKCQLEKDFIPFGDLQIFLKFASVAVRDPSFLSFFDVRDNPPHIFSCVLAIGSIVRKLVECCKLDFIFGQSETDSYGGMNDDCISVLSEFYHLMEFVEYAEQKKNFLDSELLHDLKDVVAGLGRCELVNGWILISHLGWRPQVLSKTDIFPPIQQTPLEILRTEADMLLKYISKLNLLGVASKIQFEENWVIFLSVINLYVDETFQLQIVTTGLRALSMMLHKSIKIKYFCTKVSDTMRKAATKIDLALEDVEQNLYQEIDIPYLASDSEREVSNPHGIDINSCIRFLTDLYSQWLQNPQGKMPLHLLSEVIQSIVVMAEYFEDPSQYRWMYETLIEIYKSFDKEDDILWTHLIYGIFYSAAKLDLEGEAVANLTSILETSISSPSANISNIILKCALVYLRNHPDTPTFINPVVTYALKKTQLDEISNESEAHCLNVWNLLLFIWAHGLGENIPDFEQDTLKNVLTALSPLNKVFVSVRLLVLKVLRLKVEFGDLESDVKKIIGKATAEALRTQNPCIFFHALKLYTTMFYDDFAEHLEKWDIDPDVLMLLAERSDVYFQHLRSKTKCHSIIASKILPLVITEFLPPSEILNRVIAEFLSPVQTSPELVAPVVAQVFEKSKRRPKEAALVKEWIVSSLANFVSNGNVSRAMWSLTIFFIGVSSNPELFCLLPFAQLRRRSFQIQELFVYSATDFYIRLEDKTRRTFKKMMTEGPFHCEEKKPYDFLVDALDKIEAEGEQWDRIMESP